jgi:hypothetical protein
MNSDVEVFNTMKSRVLLLATVALCCSAQIRPTAVRATVQALDERLSASTVAPRLNDFPVSTALPPVSAIVENGTLSLVIDPSAAITGGPPYRVIHVSSEIGAKSGENWRVRSSDIVSNKLRIHEPAQVTRSAGDTPISNAIEPRAVTLPIKISDVTGLSAALSQINSTDASLTTSLASLTTTVTNLNATVSTLSATVASLVPVPTFVDFEIPAGSIDGSNPVFVLNAAPSPASSMVLIKNGMKLSPGGDYSISGSTILFAAGAVPQAGDLLIASYRR